MDLRELAEWLNPIVRGWMIYYGEFNRFEMYSLLQRLSLAYHDKRRTGDVLTRVTGDVLVLEDFVVTSVSNILGSLMVLVGSFAFLAYKSWKVALIALAPGHGGSYTALALPATAARQLLVPAAIALFFWFVREPARGGRRSSPGGSPKTPPPAPLAQPQARA